MAVAIGQNQTGLTDNHNLAIFTYRVVVFRPIHIHCKNRLVVLTGEWLPWLHGLLWYNRPIV